VLVIDTMRGGLLTVGGGGGGGGGGGIGVGSIGVPDVPHAAARSAMSSVAKRRRRRSNITGKMIIYWRFSGRFDDHPLDIRGNLRTIDPSPLDASSFAAASG
jgi:hypothetical protein